MSLNQSKFLFNASGWESDAFSVVRFEGEEGLSELYRFEVTLACQDMELEHRKLLSAECTFTIDREQSDAQNFHGVLAGVQVLGESHGAIYLKATLMPRVWGLTLGVGSQIFLDKSIPEIIEAVLKDRTNNGVLPNYELQLSGDYEPREYVCQYNESPFHFISRLMEQEGIYYYFEQREGEEVLCIRDHLMAHKAKEDSALSYSPATGLENSVYEEVLTEFISNDERLPQGVLLKGYDYERPDLLPEGKAKVSDSGFGTVYYYGENFTTRAEGNRLAKVRAQQLISKAVEHQGVGSVPWLQPGFLFSLQEHFLSSFNQQYLITSIVHEGSQASYLTHGIEQGEEHNGLYYRNRFRCIPSMVQYRNSLKTKRPKITGVLSAWIDAAGSGQHAMLDDQGRYKVLMPFDLSGRDDGKASCWLRMAQPYGGSGHGMHFPLLKKTEILLSFVEGDPDRPVIQATVPNADNPSLVNENTNTHNTIQSASGSQIIMDDTSGKEVVHLNCGGAMISFGPGVKGF
ncbi:type VI secretion system Vgr family protein [Dongshaea marina]|uniref:type VI secretion system Vgr family protein n=1 Tax=Dongshaea marina TaxID=2047966 RepID=UPI000D3E80E9|nr:type VI secretion system tip protein TssI/VgrG [Dongshaea marina]